MSSGKPGNEDLRRVVEDAEEGIHGRLGDPGAPPEIGPIQRGEVDAGPTGEREGGYRRAESGRTIAIVGGVVIAAIFVGILFLYWQ
jgi:hypothetical protein